MVRSQKLYFSSQHKVVGFGLTGQAGNIHVKNLQEQGVKDLVAITRPGREHKELKNFPRDGDYKELVNQGYDRCVISTADSLLSEDAKNALNAGFKHILLEKPGAISADDLSEVQRLANEKGARVLMNY
jgi:predicted dehydrogenase